MTSDLALIIYILAGFGVGALAVVGTATRLVRAERSASDSLGNAAVMQAVALGWAGLTALIGLRIAIDATSWAFFG